MIIYYPVVHTCLKGNSGGPVINSNNQVIGVAFQSLSDEDIENIGYVVPVNVISHFLEDVERNGEYSGIIGSVIIPLYEYY